VSSSEDGDFIIESSTAPAVRVTRQAVPLVAGMTISECGTVFPFSTVSAEIWMGLEGRAEGAQLEESEDDHRHQSIKSSLTVYGQLVCHLTTAQIGSQHFFS